METLIRLITFATDNFTISADRLKATALRYGVDNVRIYDEGWLGLHYVFDRIVQSILPDSRGYGWWIWKPYIINEAIGKMDNGDYLVYCDAGTEFTGNIQPLIDSMDEDIFLCSNGWQHSHWCKREVAEAINSNYVKHNLDKYFEHKQVQASFIVFKVNSATRKFIQEWYAWSIMPGFIDNTPRGPQFPEFQEHRHDQAILCCLQIKYGYKLRWFPSTMAMHLQHDFPLDNYPAILNHHRKRNSEW